MHTCLLIWNLYGATRAKAGLIGHTLPAALVGAMPAVGRGHIDGYIVTVVLMFLITIFALWRLWNRR